MKKMFITSVAAVGIAGMIGGGTFAAYSDTDTVTGNNINADVLQLELSNERSTALTPITFNDMGPGEGSSQRLYVGTRTDDTERSPAKLSMNLVSTAEDDNGCIDPETDVDTTCGAGEGELADNLVVTIQTFRATEVSPGVYDADFSGAGRISSVTSNVSLQSLLDGTAFDIHTFPVGGDDVVAVQIWWTVPAGVGNVIQSDSSSFDIEYTLDQVV